MHIMFWVSKPHKYGYTKVFEPINSVRDSQRDGEYYPPTSMHPPPPPTPTNFPTLLFKKKVQFCLVPKNWFTGTSAYLFKRYTLKNLIHILLTFKTIFIIITWTFQHSIYRESCRERNPKFTCIDFIEIYLWQVSVTKMRITSSFQHPKNIEAFCWIWFSPAYDSCLLILSENLYARYPGTCRSIRRVGVCLLSEN